MSSSIAALQKVKARVLKDIELMEKELKTVEEDNAAKQIQYEKEQILLMEQRAETDFHEQKLALLKKSLSGSERQLAEAKGEYSKKLEEVKTMVDQYRRDIGQRNEQLRTSLQMLRVVNINEDDHYGDMDKFNREVKQEMDNAKTKEALSQQEVSQKKDEMRVLKKSFASIDHPEIKPEVKKEISEACLEALKAQRKKLVDLKMKNHELKCKVDSFGGNEK